MSKNARYEALIILEKLITKKVPLTQSFNQKDIAPLTKELCFGVARFYFRLEAIADFLTAKRPKSAQVFVTILMGIYQIQYLRAPDYAVVKETVQLLQRSNLPWAKGLVNAVLRRFCREREDIFKQLEANHLFLYNHPEWFVKALKKTYPENWQECLKENDMHPPMSLRVSARKSSVGEYIKNLEAHNIKAKALRFSADGIKLDKPCKVEELPGFKEGLVSVQDESAQLAVSLLELKPNLKVLDACSAPGGKTCHILEHEPNLKQCIALDIDDNRIKLINDNLQRLNLNATVITNDASIPETWWDGEPFDRILLDAPCTATGIIRRHSDIKLMREHKDVVAITKTQEKLLNALWPLLAKSGIMVYATCSVLAEENELQIKKFCERNPDCIVANKAQPWGITGKYGWQILPGTGDGFFYSQLRKI